MSTHEDQFVSTISFAVGELNRHSQLSDRGHEDEAQVSLACRLG